jgi:ParB-like chromosome segregation protein Spo0J
LHEARGLTELEEGWLVRALYREHGLLQPAIAQRLGRHKSWVHRRLMLVEALDGAVQAAVRLGLLAPRAAVVLGRLPRGNQHASADVVVRRGLTVRQTELLVTELLECPDNATRVERIARYGGGALPAARPGVRATRVARAEADWLAADVATVHRTAARLQARLLAAPVETHGANTAELIVNGLRGLEPVLGALLRSIESVVTTGRAVA